MEKLLHLYIHSALIVSFLFPTVSFLAPTISMSIKRKSRGPNQYTRGETLIYANPSVSAWNPQQASEFITWHVEDPEKAGQQLAPLIHHWNGNDVGEFLTRMYLGQVDEENFTISYHPSYVRNPKWLGLGEDGLRYLTIFFQKALPAQALLAEEISRFADYFLLKEHKWPKETNATDKDGCFETDSFANQGHAADIARVFGYVRRERLGDFSAADVIDLVVPSKNQDQNLLLKEMPAFFGNLGIQLTSNEKIIVVEGLAKKGCAPGLIARLISSFEEISEEARLTKLEEQKELPEAIELEKSTRTKKASPMNSPVETPLDEILSPTSGSLGLEDFESRWLPEELLQNSNVEQ